MIYLVFYVLVLYMQLKLMSKTHENMQYALFAILCVNSLIYSTDTCTTITVAVSHSSCLLPSSQMLSWAIQE